MSFEVVSSAQLRQYIEKVEHLEEEKAELMDAIREVFAEAKGNGFDVPALRAIIRLRREDVAKRQEREAMIELYRDTMGID